METKDARSLSPSAQEAVRMRAVKAVLEGQKQRDVARMFGVTVQSICKWVKLHRLEGSQGLKAKKRGRRKGSSLLPWQAAQIVQTVQGRCPDQLRLPFMLWTRDAVSLLIEARFGLRLSKRTVGRYLRRWGFTPQKPLRRAYEQDPKAVKRWVEKTYPEIRKRAVQKKALIFWGDEMGLRSDHAVGRSYGIRGQTPVIEGAGRRFGCNMVSAITNQGHLNFMVFEDGFVTDVFIEFMRRLVRQHARNIFLIVDGHPVHRARKTRQWLAKHEKEIELFYLPAYSPELNPDELLNQDVKTNTVRKTRPKSLKELMRIVRGHLWSRQWRPDIIRNFFKKQPVAYAG
jgi:transposase